MSNKLLMGLWRFMLPIPRVLWQRQISETARKMEAALGFRSEEHHLIHDFVVRELPRVNEPMSPEFIAQKLNLSVARVKVILVKLEKYKAFLFRNEQGAVTWAYPVTVDSTPHHVTFSTGEEVYSA